jgi:tetratricopeptide (TPR) repeat protein
MNAEGLERWRGGKGLFVLTLALVANSAYLAAFGDPTLFFVANSLLHPFLGIAVAVLLAVFVARNRAFWRGATGYGALALLFVGTVSGLQLLHVGMLRSNAWALYLHIASTVLGILLLLVHVAGRVRSGDAPAILRTAFRWSAVVVGASAALYVAASAYHRLVPDPRHVIRNPETPPLAMEGEGGGVKSFMFPSSAETPDNRPIDSSFFMNSESCKRCHEDIFRQWSSSMHRFASFNNQWYRKSIEYMQDLNGIKSSLWCGGCHDHALVLAGKMQQRHVREMIHLPESQAGLGCMSCHAITQVKSTMGQGDFVIEYPALAEYGGRDTGFMRWLHDFQVKLNPKPHRRAFLKPFHKEDSQKSEFCSTCHKVHLDVPVNNYRWLRGFNDYDNWQASGVSGQGARSFYYPPKPQNCVDCHMPLAESKDFGNIKGFVHNHRFAAANTAVPTSYGDTKQIEEVEKFLKDSVTVDVFALAELPEEDAIEGPEGMRFDTPQLASTFAVGEESAAGLMGGPTVAMRPAKLRAPLGRAPASLRPGETVRVQVVVRTRRVGHFFPGGTVDAFDVWVELQARDGKGRVIYWSGMVEDDGRGPVEPGAHFYRSLQLDAHGNPINKRNAWATRAVMYTRLIPPGAADTVHFRLKVPEDASGEITLHARLNYRKFAWWNTQWAFAGIPDPEDTTGTYAKDYDSRRWIFKGDLLGVSAKYKEIPDVPIVVISEAVQRLPVAPRGAPPFEEKIELHPEDRERWNDYGIGLFLQGDLKGAERAFRTVTELEPDYADGWVNIGRVRVREGDVEGAREVLRKALELNPSLASARYFYGLVLKAEGKYKEAYEEFARAAALYPRDRVVRNQLGRMLFLQRRFAEAVEELKKTLAVDPEDLEAHYNLMLSYRGLNDDERATHHEKLYLRFKADESARAITGPYKLKNPHDNNEAQAIHDHPGVPLEVLKKLKPAVPAGSRYARSAEEPSARHRLQKAGGQPPAATPAGNAPARAAQSARNVSAGGKPGK